jgi:hypothetical protein
VPSHMEKAVEAIGRAIAEENYWDKDAPEVRRGLARLSRCYYNAARPHIEGELRERLLSEEAKQIGEEVRLKESLKGAGPVPFEAGLEAVVDHALPLQEGATNE